MQPTIVRKQILGARAECSMLGDWNQEPEHSTLRDGARMQCAENWEPEGGALGAKNQSQSGVHSELGQNTTHWAPGLECGMLGAKNQKLERHALGQNTEH